jgi:hypothetical protein
MANYKVICRDTGAVYYWSMTKAKADKFASVASDRFVVVAA